MTRSKLIKCINTPWSSGSGRPLEMYLWVSPELDRKVMWEEFHVKRPGLGFADWLVEQDEALDAVAEEWGCE